MNIDFTYDSYLLYRALKGDVDATKMYCGSYKLVIVSGSSRMYRAKELIGAMQEVKEYMGESVYDNDGFLKPIFWSLPRI